MRILFFGDVVGRSGRQCIRNNIDNLCDKYRIDFVICNGENATHGKGLNRNHYLEFLDMGIDCITLGNHYNTKNEINRYIDDAEEIVRPINLKNNFGGSGSQLFNIDGVLIRVTNILGNAFMSEEVTNNIEAMDDLLEKIQDEESIHIVDFHGEATAEKEIFGYVFDGVISAVIGTHTHVQTRDFKILENGTGYISDVGMCGSHNGVLGFKKESVIDKIVYGKTGPFIIDEADDTILSAVVMDIDEDTYKCQEIFSIYLLEKGEKNGTHNY